MKKCVTEDFIRHFESKYPKLIGNLPFRKMLMHLAFGTFVSKHNKKLIIPYQMLANFAKADIKNIKSVEQRNWSSAKFLEAFKADVLNSFAWNESAPVNDSWEIECRTVENKGFSEDDLKVIGNEILKESNDKYFFVSGKKLNDPNLKTSREEHSEIWNRDSAKFNLNFTQQKIMDGLSPYRINGRTFLERLNANKHGVYAAIEALELDHDDKETLEEKKARHYKILESIKEDPRVFYRPTPLGRTARLHHDKECVLSLSKDVRKALCKGWYEADLVSSQFVILASILDAPLSKAFAKSGDSLWAYLNQACGNTGEPSGKLKRIFKSVIYGIAFGKTRKNLKETCGNIPEILESPIIKELLDRRDDWFASISRNGYVTDIWGTVHKLEQGGIKTDIYGNKVLAKRRWEGAIAATKIQSIEMEIISAVFDVLNDHGEQNQFNITLFQHDGFTYSQSRKESLQTIKNHLNRAIAKKAKEVGDKLGIDLSAVKLEIVQL